MEKAQEKPHDKVFEKIRETVREGQKTLEKVEAPNYIKEALRNLERDVNQRQQEASENYQWERSLRN